MYQIIFEGLSQKILKLIKNLIKKKKHNPQVLDYNNE